MARGWRKLEALGELLPLSFHAAFWIYLYCLSRILLLPLTDWGVSEAFLMPVVLGRNLEFWINACNVLWMLLFTVRLIALVMAGWRTSKADLILVSLALAGLGIVEAGLPVVFNVLATHSSWAQ